MNEVIHQNNSNTLEIEHLSTGDIKLNEDTKYIAFYADIPHNKIDEVVEDIKTWYVVFLHLM